MPGFVHTPSPATGAHVLGTSIWCDAARARGVCFLSRADVDAGRGGLAQAIATERTASQRRALGLPGGDALVPRYGRPFALGRARLELLPAGGVPGSAQLLVELGGWRGLYAGELIPGVGEPPQLRACDELVVLAPETGGVRDEPEALFAAAEAGEALAFDGLLALSAIAERLGRERVAPPPRWARALGGRGSRRPAGGVVRLHPWRPGVRARVVRAGLRAAGEHAIALGLGAGVDELVAFALGCGARRVHVRVPARSSDPLRRAGAAALVEALAARRVDARLLGAPEQLPLRYPASR